MSVDIPFGMEDATTYPTCEACGDAGIIEVGDGDRVVPCSACRPDEYDYVMEVGGVEP